MIWTALILGFVGSLHCIGMCSPLAMAATTISAKLIINRLVYHSGRILVYGLLGALVASAGFAFQISKYQNAVSIVLGLVLIAAASTNRFPIHSNKLFNKLNVQLKMFFSGLLKIKNHFSVFLLGILNGFLPCGLTIVALSYCVISPSIGEGFGFMLLFGIGTLPALIGFASIFRWATHRLNFRPQFLMNSLQMLSGVILIARVFFIHTPHATNLIDIVLCGM
jgi:sulfite exporter TauE/SafE